MLARKAFANIYRPFRRQTTPGTRPGTVKVAKPDSPPVIRVIAYGNDEIVEQQIENIDDIKPFLERHRVTWINVDGLAADVINKLGAMFSLHPLALEDVVNVHQRAKVEEYDDHVFVVARMVASGERLDNEQMSIFLGKNYVLTIQERTGDCLDPVRKRLKKARGRIREAGADYLCYALMDAVIDGYFPVLETYGTRLDDLEDQAEHGIKSSVIAELHRIRGDLLLLRRSIWPHREAVSSLLRDEHDLIAPETRMYLRDCYDHTVQLIDVSETYREMCSDLRDLHYSLVNQRTNDVMKMLTIIATIFIPLGFIAGLYGMNFNTSTSEYNMPELNWAFGYPFALGLMGTIAVALLFYFWRRGWIGSGE